MPEVIPPDTLFFEVDRASTGLGTPDFEIPGHDVAEWGVSRRAGKASDDGKLVIYNDDFEYTAAANEIDIGDRITIEERREGSGAGFGDEPFGSGPFGEATNITRLGTYRVLDWDIIGHGGGASDLALKVADFVFSTLSNRHVWVGMTNAPISGTDDAVLNTVLQRKCPEIDRSALPTIPDTIDYFAQGVEVRKVVDELAAIAAEYVGPVIQASAGISLVFRPIRHLSPVVDSPLPSQAFGPLATSSESHDLTNWVRISGGIDAENNIDEEQTAISSYQTPTNANPIITQTGSRKSELPEIELYTYNANGATTSDVGIRVRLQATNATGDGPIAPGDTDSDYVTGSNRKVALSPDGFTTWKLGDHTINERRPWIIIDSGDEGTPAHDIGVNIDGVPAYRAHFAKQIEAVLPDRESINQYGQVDTHIERRSLTSREAVRSVARAELERHAQPDIEIGPVPALSSAAHKLQVGDIVPFDKPGFRADGNFLVTRREDTYSGAKLFTDLTFRGLDTYV